MTPITDYSPDPTLTPQQHRIISLLSQGNTITESAAAEYLHRNTVANWRRTIPAFARELEHALREQRQYWQEQATRLAPLAIQVLEETLTDPKASPSLRFRAAALIIKMATEPKAAKKPDTLPLELDALDDQKLQWQKQIAAQENQHLENDAQMHNGAQAAPEEPEIFDIEESARISMLPENRPKPQPIRVPAQPGRNALCPCKSGLKYKRCCLNQAAAA